MDAVTRMAAATAAAMLAAVAVVAGPRHLAGACGHVTLAASDWPVVLGLAAAVALALHAALCDVDETPDDP